MTDLEPRWPSLEAATRIEPALPPLTPAGVLWASLDRRLLAATALLAPLTVAALVMIAAPSTTGALAWSAVVAAGLVTAYVVATHLPGRGGAALATPCALAAPMLLIAGASMLHQPGADHLLLGVTAIGLAGLQRAVGTSC